MKFQLRACSEMMISCSHHIRLCLIALSKELARAVGLGGRDRRAGSLAERDAAQRLPRSKNRGRRWWRSNLKKKSDARNAESFSLSPIQWRKKFTLGLRQPRKSSADAFVGQSDLIKSFQRLRSEAVVVIYERHACVAAVTRDVDVSDFVIDWECVKRQVGLQEAARSLRLDDGQHLFDRSPETAINPW
jgi:hypothetical protein